MPKPAQRPLQICRPRGKRGPPVLVIHSWWGLTPAFTAFGAALARKGFVVGLADLFDGAIATTPAEAKRLRRKPRREPMYKTLIRNIDELRAVPGATAGDIGVVGFSMGGHWAVWLSQRPALPIGATVLYYAVRAGNFADSHAAVLAHYADDDPWVSRASRRRMEAALAKADCRYQPADYPGTRHWFAENDRAQEFDEAASALAFERTVTHLKDNL